MTAQPIPQHVAVAASKILRKNYSVEARDIIELFRHSSHDLSGASVDDVVKQVHEWFRETDREYRRSHKVHV